MALFLRVLFTVLMAFGLLESIWVFTTLMNTADDLAVIAALALAVIVPFLAFWILRYIWGPTISKMLSDEEKPL